MEEEVMVLATGVAEESLVAVEMDPEKSVVEGWQLFPVRVAEAMVAVATAREKSVAEGSRRIHSCICATIVQYQGNSQNMSVP